MMRHVEVQNFGSFEEEVTYVEECRSLYDGLYHRNGNFDAEYGDMTVEDKLDIMESFVRVTPMPVKSGEMVFLCNCGDAYCNYGCEHSGATVLSMLWNQDMKFPDVGKGSKDTFESVCCCG
jgi:hypothetical protein